MRCLREIINLLSTELSVYIFFIDKMFLTCYNEIKASVLIRILTQSNGSIMNQEYIGEQGIADEDRSYCGSHPLKVLGPIFLNPFGRNGRNKTEAPIPGNRMALSNFLCGSNLFGRPHQLTIQPVGSSIYKSMRTNTQSRTKICCSLARNWTHYEFISPYNARNMIQATLNRWGLM